MADPNYQMSFAPSQLHHQPTKLLHFHWTSQYSTTTRMSLFDSGFLTSSKGWNQSALGTLADHWSWRAAFGCNQIRIVSNWSQQCPTYSWWNSGVRHLPESSICRTGTCYHLQAHQAARRNQELPWGTSCFLCLRRGSRTAPLLWTGKGIPAREILSR